jgi:hypothetical protein
MRYRLARRLCRRVARRGIRETNTEMNFLKYEFDLGLNDAVEVRLDKQANVRLLDGQNFQRFRSGQKHEFYGGRALTSPYVVRAPRSGRWYLVIDLGGNAGTVNASVRVI